MKHWTEWERKKLLAALRLGGIPEAVRVFGGKRSRASIECYMESQGIDVRGIGGIETVTASDIMIEADVSQARASQLVRYDPLGIQRGKHRLLPRCRLQAYLNERPPVREAGFGMLSSKQAAEHLGVSSSAFSNRWAAELRDVRLEVVERKRRKFLYPFAAVDAIKKSGRIRGPNKKRPTLPRAA